MCIEDIKYGSDRVHVQVMLDDGYDGVLLYDDSDKVLGLKELCSKSCSLCFPEFPKILHHYAHNYSFMLLIVIIIP